jgi:hypothetical protein
VNTVLNNRAPLNAGNLTATASVFIIVYYNRNAGCLFFVTTAGRHFALRFGLRQSVLRYTIKEPTGLGSQ